ncbi:TY4B-J [Symbiodinium necroappetens]|uniref:TY4B-J protein n=1 Tax=Symbiodinium necroappetens TaxID=1628268 RepID=A0A813AQS0_9DINO|nr:TY4B-J [Symbiodinium necroappetens]
MVPEGETPLFDRTQTRRLQEMTDQAPQLYGPRAQTGAASDTSGSYSKEQLEAEVRRQVELALSSQKGLAEENQRLRLQVERLSTEVSSRGGVGRQPSTLMTMGSTATRHVDERERKGDEATGRGAPKAINLDFLDMGVSKGADQKSLTARPKQEAIHVDIRDMRDFQEVMFLGPLEYPKAIHQDFLDMDAGKGVCLRRHRDTSPTMTTSQGVRRASSSPPPQRAYDETAQEPGVSDGGTAPMDALIKGMSQLQGAMALQMGLAANKPEVIRPGVSGAELPKLQEPDDQAAINIGDWLHGLAGPMGDLTDGSAKWWGEVMVSLDRFYQDYMAAPTVRKVQLRAEDYLSPELREPKWLRLDKRAASMLLQAVPEGLKNELLANRLNTTVGILGRILVIYRPGSAAERQQVLRALENPGSSATAADLVEVLRKWMRWLKRAQDLGLQVPDPSILLQGLDSAARQMLDKSPEVVFRSNMMRFSLDSDSNPSLDSILRYHGHLLAEFEQLSFRGRSKGAGGSNPVVKSLTTGQDAKGALAKSSSSPGGGSSSKPCKFYLSETGCQRTNCKFLHDWQSVPKEDRNNKCKGCGGKGHMKKDCPLKSGGEGAPREESGKGSGAPRVKNLNNNDKREEGATQAQDSSSTSPTATTGMAGSLGTPTTPTMPTSSTTTNQSSEDFLKSATQILKLMAEQSGASSSQMPSMKMLKKAVSEMEARMALVDSGATHPLRRAQGPEWERSPEVDVVVAGDSVAKMRQNETGTLLTSPGALGSQTILPVGSLVKLLGYELVWTKRGCTLRASDGREIALKVSTGCPEISEATALELIAKIEEEKLNQLKERAEVTKLAMLRAWRC